MNIRRKNWSDTYRFTQFYWQLGQDCCGDFQTDRVRVRAQ